MKKTYVEVTVRRKPKTLLERMELVPYPDKLEYKEEYFPFPMRISIQGLGAANEQVRTMETLTQTLSRMPGVQFAQTSGFPFQICFQKNPKIDHEEGYELVINKNGAMVFSKTFQGEYYACQTLCQILSYSYFPEVALEGGSAAESDAVENKYVPVLFIKDAPKYAVRSFMIDLGRSVFPMPLIKRIIRIISHLKMNTLHMHLLDDELCGIKLNKLPLGHENPFAVTLPQLADIVAYARSYHVSIMPEIESWGHVQSVIYHFPETYGSPGMWGGSSFGIGEKTYQLLEKVYDEIMPVLEEKSMFHVGLDEALWAVLPGEEKKGHNPTNMVSRIYQILQRSADRHRREIQMHLWADHGGRPLPAEIRKKVVIQPWKYRQTDEKEIAKAVREYGGASKTPFMMGAGWSSIHYHGSYEATRLWAQHGARFPNALGVTSCMWCTNDLAGQIDGLYRGADYSWTPDTPERRENDPMGEDLRGFTSRWRRHWQVLFPDANPDALRSDQGPEVYAGRYVWPPMAGLAAAPTADFRPIKSADEVQKTAR